MQELNAIVKEMLDTYKGGEVFFDNLDNALRNKSNLVIIKELLNKINNIQNSNIIVSGKFGVFFKQYIKIKGIKTNSLICVGGGLRKGKSVNLSKETLENSEYIFIDDSFYSGATKNAIEKELNKINSHIKTTYVIYDGSINKCNSIVSLYRYY